MSHPRGKFFRDTYQQKETFLENDSDILDALDFEPEDTDAVALAALLETNSVLVDSIDGQDLQPLYLMAGLEALKAVICGTDEMNAERIKIEIAHEAAFGAALEVLALRALNKNSDERGTDE